MRVFRLFAAIALLAGGLAIVVVPAGVASADLSVASISAGPYHTCAVTSGGAAMCWGNNAEGELGDGTMFNRIAPVAVSGLSSGVAMVSSGVYGSCALTTSGAVKCWGHDDLGDGTTFQSDVPVAVVGLSAGVSAIAGGGGDACALTTGGAVECWGDNAVGQLGDGTTNPSLVPETVTGLGSGVAAIAGALDDTCAVTTAGALKCWGYNQDGELGDGTTTNRLTPVGVAGLSSGVVSVSAGSAHTCAVMTDGSVKCWGLNPWGEVGDGTTTQRLSPVDVVGLDSAAVSVSVGGDHTCALTAAGAVECWGHNDWGQLGDGPVGNSHTPVDVAGLESGMVEVTTGGDQSCAVDSTGAMSCWGNDFEGQLGNGNASQLPTPTDVVDLGSDVATVAAGFHHSCALLTSGALMCWGDNDHGQLGDGTTLERDRPVPVAGLGANVVAVSGGYDHTCALTMAGAVECWGDNDDGELGDGTTTQQHLPVGVVGLGSGVVAITTAPRNTCALTDTGAVECWGDNSVGQLGNGTTTSSDTPVAVSGLGADVVSISEAGTSVCALTSLGAVECWGGQSPYLGDGTTNTSSVPVPVSGLSSGVTSISVGGSVSCAVTTAQAVECWGGGALGNGTVALALTPVAIPDLAANIAQVEAGAGSYCALTTAGGVDCWGENANGELGDGSTFFHDTPVATSGLGAGVTSLSVQGDHACAVISSTAECWGNNTSGQLGIGTSGYTTVPIGVVGLGLDGATTADAPGDVSAAPADAAASVSWTPPADDGGAAVYGYLVTIIGADGGAPSGVTGSRVRVATSDLTLSTDTSLHVSGLSNGVTYRLDVAPINRAGVGVSTVSSIVVPVSHAQSGYWMVGATGSVYAFGGASYRGNANLRSVVHLEPTPSHNGYWIVNALGVVSAFGDAEHLPSAGPMNPGEYVIGLSSTPTGHGYWFFTNRGRVMSRGDAPFFGDLHTKTLNGSIVGAIATATGEGYYMVGSDGGVFAFGDAKFRGSMGAERLNKPVESIVPSADNRGYWLVASDGGVFSFGAAFHGSTGGKHLNRPVIGMVRYGSGYLMIASDGGVFDFANLAFRGSLAAHPPAQPIVSVASTG